MATKAEWLAAKAELDAIEAERRELLEPTALRYHNAQCKMEDIEEDCPERYSQCEGCDAPIWKGDRYAYDTHNHIYLCEPCAPAWGDMLSDPSSFYDAEGDQPGSLQFYEDVTKAGKERIRQLEQELSMLGAVGAELAAAKYAQDLVNDAIAKNVTLSKDQIATIQDQARAYGKLSEELARSKLQLDLQFEHDQIGRSDLDQTVASRLQSAGLPIDLNSYEAGLIRANEVLKEHKAEWEDIRDIGRDAIDGIVDSAVEGFDNIEDMAKDLGKDILKEFLQLSIANPLKNAIYGDGLPTLDSMGGIGGFFKALLGGAMPESARATGTMSVTAGVVNVTGGIGVGGGFNPSPSGFADMLFGRGAANGNTGSGNPPMSLSGIGSPGSAPLRSGSIADYIRQAALARGIDPEIALRVARSEGGLTDPFRQGESMLSYGREQSFGPFQLHMRNGGVGVRALAAGIDPRTNWQGGVDYALDEAANKGWGQWFGAAKAGIGDREGLEGARALGKFTTELTRATPSVSGLERAAKVGAEGIGQFGQTLANAGSGAGGGGGILGWLFGGSNWGSNLGDLTWDTWANGGAFSRGNVIPFANGDVVTRPTRFPMAGGRTGLMGEAGDEGIMPLRRNSRGQLGVIASGERTPVNVQLNVVGAQQPVDRVEEEDDGNGGRKINLVFGDMWAAEATKRGSPVNSQLRAMGVRSKPAMR